MGRKHFIVGAVLLSALSLSAYANKTSTSNGIAKELIIKLKENDFNKLQMLQSTSHYQHVVYSMFIIPALIFALESIEEDVEIMRERLWFRSLEKAFKANNIELNKTTVEQRTSYVMAQLLLEDPIGRALTSLTEIRGEN